MKKQVRIYQQRKKPSINKALRDLAEDTREKDGLTRAAFTARLISIEFEPNEIWGGDSDHWHFSFEVEVKE